MKEPPGHQTTDWRAAAQRAGIPLSQGPTPMLVTAQLLALRGERRAAEAACRELLSLSPDDLGALAWLAVLQRTEGRHEEAAELRRRALDLEARRSGLPPLRREETIAFDLATEGYAAPPDRVPAAYLAARFDKRAHEFDALLRGKLAYRGPELAHGAVTRALERRAGIDRRTGLDVLDAGCGTGLAAHLLRPLARRLDGVDLSPGMLGFARSRELYDDLEEGELVLALKARPGRYDLVFAVDVFIYFGALEEVMAAAAQSLRPEGLLALSVERGEGDGWVLNATGRYTHSAAYVSGAAAGAGLTEVSLEEVVLRTEATRPVRAYVAVYERPGSE